MIRGVVERYSAFLGQPGVVRMLVLTFVARLPLGTLTLALLMHVQAMSGSFAVAGATVGAYLAAAAVTSPFVGRWIDRRGPILALAITGIVCPTALLAVLFAPQLDLAQPAIYALAGVAGAFVPPVTVLFRTILRQRFARDDERRTAFALDSVLVETAFTVGPLITAVLLALATPAVAFAAAWCFVACAVPMFLASRALAYFRVERDGVRHLLGPLTEPALLVVYLLHTFIAFTFGLLEVAYPGFGTALGTPALGAVLIAINSVGSAVGGLAYGGLRFHRPPEKQLPLLLALMVVPLALQPLTASAGLLMLFAFVAGLLIAPALTVVMLLVSTNAPARYATEAFTWSATAIISGISIGAAVGGQLVQHYGAGAAFTLAAASIAAAALVATRVQRLRNIS